MAAVQNLLLSLKRKTREVSSRIQFKKIGKYDKKIAMWSKMYSLIYNPSFKKKKKKKPNILYLAEV